MLIQLGKHHKIFGISTKVNSISCPNDNIHFSLVHMLDLDIIVAGIDNIHATDCIFLGKSGSVEYWTLVVNRTWGTRYWRWPRRWQGFRKLRPQGKCWKSNIVFCLPHKGIVLSRLSVIWVSTKTCVHCNALDLWDQVKRTKKRTLEVEKDWIAREGTRLNRKMKIKAFLSLMRF